MRVIDVIKTQYKISDFVSWQKQGTLDLSPDFQRRPVWKKGAKSYLIDTILRGFPVPIIFIREKLDLGKMEPIREVVDGQQRLRTLLGYIKSELLVDFKPQTDRFNILKSHNEEFANCSFEDLSEEARHQILNYQFSVHILPSDVSDREVLQVFSRMNATGVKLKAQELRNAEYYGEFKTSVYDIALTQLDRWKDWKLFSEAKIARMEEVEFVSEIYGLILKGIKGNKQDFINSLYDEYDDIFLERLVVEARFNKVLDLIEDHFYNTILNYKFYRNKNVFYILFSVIYDKLYGIGSLLTDSLPNKVKHHDISDIIDKMKIFEEDNSPDEFDTRRLGQQENRIKVIKYFA